MICSNSLKPLHAVIQQEATGCGIASCAALAGLSYAVTQKRAKSLGIDAQDPALWSNTQSVRRLLAELNIHCAAEETPFKDWSSLPDCALLATKWHLENQQAYWHWVVFSREAEGGEFVLDSKATLKQHKRTDLGRIKPKWFIEVFRR